MRSQPAPPGRWHRQAARGLGETSMLCRPKVALEQDRDDGGWSTLGAAGQPRSRRDRDVFVGYLSNDMTRRVYPSGPDRRSRATFWWHGRWIAQRPLGLFRRRRKFPCQGQIMASRSVSEQTNAGFGATGARRHPDQCAPLVDSSVGAIPQPRRARGVASRSRPTDRRGRRTLADARIPLRARADANQCRPQP